MTLSNLADARDRLDREYLISVNLHPARAGSVSVATAGWIQETIFAAIDDIVTRVVSAFDLQVVSDPKQLGPTVVPAAYVGGLSPVLIPPGRPFGSGHGPPTDGNLDWIVGYSTQPVLTPVDPNDVHPFTDYPGYVVFRAANYPTSVDVARPMDSTLSEALSAAAHPLYAVLRSSAGELSDYAGVQKLRAALDAAEQVLGVIP